MNQSSFTSSQDIIKAPTTLDKIPEDVQLAIIKFIQSWKKPEGTEQEREKGKRARDSALRSVALSCRKLHSLYRAELLANVTLNFKSLLSFYLALVKNPSSGKVIRSISLTHPAVGLTPEEKSKVQKDLPETRKALRAQEIRIEGTSAIKCVVEGTYRLLPNIQTLIIRDADFNIPFQSKVANNRLAPLPFLTHSLKKLFITLWEEVETNLKARNVVWIVVFCTGLRLASLGCVFDEIDFKYLSEFSDTFSGLSEIKKLALAVNFSSSETFKSYWNKAVGNQKNRKIQAMSNLLKVTKNLQCLEIHEIELNSSSGSEERSCIDTSCLSALQGSYHSLESFRLLEIGISYDDVEEYKANANFALFKNLKMLSLDANIVLFLSEMPDIEFPPGLKVLCIPYYNPNSTVSEDLELGPCL